MAIQLKIPSVNIGSRTIPARTLVEGIDFQFRSRIVSSDELYFENVLLSVEMKDQAIFSDFSRALGAQVIELDLGA